MKNEERVELSELEKRDRFKLSEDTGWEWEVFYCGDATVHAKGFDSRGNEITEVENEIFSKTLIVYPIYRDERSRTEEYDAGCMKVKIRREDSTFRAQIRDITLFSDVESDKFEEVLEEIIQIDLFDKEKKEIRERTSAERRKTVSLDNVFESQWYILTGPDYDGDYKAICLEEGHEQTVYLSGSIPVRVGGHPIRIGDLTIYPGDTVRIRKDGGDIYMSGEFNRAIHLGTLKTVAEEIKSDFFE